MDFYWIPWFFVGFLCRVNNLSTGKLYIVATPIGNLEDFTYRARRILDEVDLIYAEDTRRTRVLCNHYGISTSLKSLNAHNSHQRIPGVLVALEQGRSLALVSDAGMPVLRDPGEPVIKAVVDAGMDVEVLPGPSSVVTALAGSGFSGDRFIFEGFPPRKVGERKRWLTALSAEERTLILFESPNRLVALLRTIVEVLGEERLIVVARELTKRFETWYRGGAGSVLATFEAEPPRGEIVVLIQGSDGSESAINQTQKNPEQLLREAFESGLRVKDAARQVADQTGMPRSKLYQMALGLRE
ncbi:MAG: 16S rRNA (cytidine(1402)-2'-O)-methyltransferase [Magnetococcales bacterium]|nr:16S rRNA (cytidine(1402)-2'-O)-methyltransferase [Magnetococcales bacterium]